MNAPVDFKVLEGMFRREYSQIEVRFDPEQAVAWTYMKPTEAPCFNFGMLEELCVDSMYARICNYNSPMITISLVQGEALGGGFEIALSSNVIIAERRSRMGLPEILFNLFPGNGAYSLLSRRVGMKRAEEMIFSGRIYTATELHEMGVVDVLAEDGLGEAAVYDYICRNERRRNAMQAMFSCRQHLNPISYDELLKNTNIWVNAALRLEDKDLKLMSRLGRSQQFKRAHYEAAAEPVEEVRFATA